MENYEEMKTDDLVELQNTLWEKLEKHLSDNDIKTVGEIVEIEYHWTKREEH